jgi:homoserine O-acetyltransferase
MRLSIMKLLARAACGAVIVLTTSTGVAVAQAPAAAERKQGDYIIRAYTFRSGETLPEVKLHYTTIGTPLRDGSGKIRNGVLIMHGSSSPASQVLAASFTGPLVGPGLPLDPAKYFLIFPDLIGVGGSSKPSDGLRARFPKYGYHDMVDLEHRLIADHFGIERLRAVMGISMGGMHTWLWGARYPDMMDGLFPITSLPTKVDGRNLLWRRILSNAIRTDPEWNGGNYTSQPHGYLNIMPMFNMLVQSPVGLGNTLKSYDETDKYLRDLITEQGNEDANNMLYRFEASFDYDVSGELEKIKAPLTVLLFGDDELNPVELGVIEKVIPRVKSGKYVIVPPGPLTSGHRTQVQAAVWKDHLASFLNSLPPLPALK